MSLKSLTPNLIVDDVSATTTYYRDTLGFDFTLGVLEGSENPAFEFTGQPLGFAMLKRGDVELMLQSVDSVAVDLPGFRRGTGDAMSLYIDVADVDALYAELKDSVDVIQEICDTFYGAREFHIRDCNGFILGFARRPQMPE